MHIVFEHGVGIGWKVVDIADSRACFLAQFLPLRLRKWMDIALMLQTLQDTINEAVVLIMVISNGHMIRVL